jgi:hypothetical protein
MIGDWRKLWSYSTTNGVPQRSLQVTLVVGTLLNLINQSDAIFSSSNINWFKLALTYPVPYLVSTYGAVAYRLKAGE